MDEDVVIRAARDEELDDVATLVVAAYAEFAATMSPDAWSMFAQDIANVRGRSTQGELLVALIEDRLVGCVTLFREWRGAQPDAAAVRTLAVAPAEQGGGVGRALLGHCVKAARADGKHRVVLTVSEQMEVARDLTERMGFVRAPELDHEPAPGVRMRGYALDLGG